MMMPTITAYKTPAAYSQCAELVISYFLDVIMQVKVAILKYIESLARQMDPADFVNSSETRLAVSRIITWTTEPKSSDVRKVSFHGDVLTDSAQISAAVLEYDEYKLTWIELFIEKGFLFLG